MIAIKNWFLKKQGYEYDGIEYLKQNILKIKKETEKAVLISIQDHKEKLESYEMWVPKTCLIDEWEEQEKPTSPFAYHDYLVEIANIEYEKDNLLKKTIIRSGRNRYKGNAFIHQYKTKELQALLDKYNIKYMTYQEFKKR